MIKTVVVPIDTIELLRLGKTQTARYIDSRIGEEARKHRLDMERASKFTEQDNLRANVVNIVITAPVLPPQQKLSRSVLIARRMRRIIDAQ